MYSGTTFRNKSGRVIGTHQKIDRVARRHLRKALPKGTWFPPVKDILHFEGKNGPDGIKSKSPGVDEPWHFIDPEHMGEHQLFDLISDHIHNLAVALQGENSERAAFEAAWLAHAVVDGLTPAHHYPYEEKLEEIRGESIETRTRWRDKVLMPGESRRHKIRNNWEFWGTKGLMTTHLGFEFGVATAIATLRFDEMTIDVSQLDNGDFITVYKKALDRVNRLGMYEEFLRRGWTRKLAKQTRDELAPLIIEVVALSWYTAILAKEDDHAA